jgi:ribonuclease E
LQVQLPVELATFLFNEKRQSLLEIEKTYNIDVLLLPNPHLNCPQYKIHRVKRDELDSLHRKPVSYQLLPKVDLHHDPVQVAQSRQRAEEPPAVETIVSQAPEMVARSPKADTSKTERPGLIKRMLNKLLNKDESSSEAQPQVNRTGQHRAAGNQQGDQRNRRNNYKNRGRRRPDQRRSYNNNRDQEGNRSGEGARSGGGRSHYGDRNSGHRRHHQGNRGRTDQSTPNTAERATVREDEV